MDIRKLQRAIVDGLEDVKAQDIQVFNTEHLSPLFERVIVASGTSNRQTKSLAASVRDAVRTQGFPVMRTEGEENGEWIIVDCGAAVAHIMQPAIRQYYHLEEIWGGKVVKMKFGQAKTGLVKAEEAVEAGKADEDTGAPGRSAHRSKPAASRSRTQPGARSTPSAAQSRTRVAGKPAGQATRKATPEAAPQAAEKAPVKSASPTTTKKAAAKAAAKKAPAKKAPSGSTSATGGGAAARAASGRGVVSRPPAKSAGRSATPVASAKSPARKAAAPAKKASSRS